MTCLGLVFVAGAIFFCIAHLAIPVIFCLVAALFCFEIRPRF